MQDVKTTFFKAIHVLRKVYHLIKLTLFIIFTLVTIKLKFKIQVIQMLFNFSFDFKFD